MRLYLLRHGEVTSHDGDVPITADAERFAFEVGRGIGVGQRERIVVLSGETRRAVDTAARLADGIIDSGRPVDGPRIAFALRNPDLYVAGVRVNMVSSADALADQVEGLAASDVRSLEFFPEFIESKDRIGWWLKHPSPPGEGATSVADRVGAFARSLVDPVASMPGVVVAVTHSPVIRAAAANLLGRDIGEPPWVAGLDVQIDTDQTLCAETITLEPA